MSPTRCILLVVDDDARVREKLADQLAVEFEVLAVESATSALELLSRRPIDIALVRYALPDVSGPRLLAAVEECSPQTVRLLSTDPAQFAEATGARAGQVARNQLLRGDAGEILHAIRLAARTFLLERSQQELLQQLQQFTHDLEERVRDRTRDLEEANHQLQQKNWMLEKLALTDPLTRLPNRRAGERLLKSELRRRARYPGCLAIAVIDADHFKEINARYLLPGGDQVLVGLARTLTSTLRTVDGLARIGGEEFLLVAPETNAEGAAALGERIRSAVESSRYCYQGQTIRVTVSVGFAVVESGVAVTAEELRHLASLALAEAKSSGRNRCVVRRFVSLLPQAG